MKKLAELLKRRVESKPVTPKGINGFKSLYRSETAKLLGISFKRVAGMTSGWRDDQIKSTLQRAKEGKNPPALWWTLYKQVKTIYGRQGKRISKGEARRIAAQRRQKVREEIAKKNGQEVLF